MLSSDIIARLATYPSSELSEVVLIPYTNGFPHDRLLWHEGAKVFELLCSESVPIPYSTPEIKVSSPSSPLALVWLEFRDGTSWKFAFTSSGFSFSDGPRAGKMFTNPPLATWLADYLASESKSLSIISDRIRHIEDDTKVKKTIRELHSKGEIE